MDRPPPQSKFDPIDMLSAFTSLPYDVTPASLKYIRFRYIIDPCEREPFITHAYYHRDRESTNDGVWWLRLTPTVGERIFEDD